MSGAQVIFGDARVPPDDLRRALKEAGITRIDTAARYANGESEKLIGRSGLSKDFTIDTKILFDFPGDGTMSADKIEKSTVNSLQALQLDKVNVLYSHAPDKTTPIPEQAKAMDDQYRKGRFTHLGVSNFPPSMVQEWLDVADKEGYVKPTVFQGHYNLVWRNDEDELFPLLRKHGIVYNAYSPLGGGFLLGHFTPDGVHGGSRFKSMEMYVKMYDTPGRHQAIVRLKEISAKTGIGMDELSLRWLKHHSILSEQDAMIIGASKVEQIGNNMSKLGKGPLEDSVVKELDGLWDLVKNESK